MTLSFKKVSSPISILGVKFSLHSKLKTFVPLFAFFALGFIAATCPLAAQAIDVTTSNDLNAAISTINTSAAAGSVQFLSNSLDLSTLSAPLGTFQFNTTLTGTNYVTITNSTLGATASLSSTAEFILSPNYAVSILGAGSFGQDSNGNGLAGNAASVAAGSLGLTSGAALNVIGGEGNDSSSAVNAIGGNGGNAALAVSGSVSVDSSSVNVNGGSAGSGYYANGGNGGNATASIGSNLNLAATSVSSSFSVIGGEAGGGDDCCESYGVGGAGGSATLTVGGIISMDSSQVTVMGGDGNYGYGQVGLTGGAGGNAWLSSNGLVVTSNSLLGSFSNFLVQGGSGSYDVNNTTGANGGNGGNAGLAISGAVSVDSSGVTVLGGDSGYADYGNAGNAGNAWVSVGSLTLTSDNYYNTSQVIGAYGYFEDYGGNGASVTYGNGGNGGNATFLSAGAVSLDSAGLDVEGQGGGFSHYTNGGNGGNGLLSVNSNLTVTSTNDNSQLYVYGGDGGDNKGYASGVGGNGGTATLLVSGAVSIDSTNDGYVDGGSAGSGYGLAGQTEGSGGNAYASMASLSLTSNQYDDGVGNGEQSYFEVGGGSGGNDYYDDYGPGGNAGNGGNGTLLISKGLSVDSAEVTVYGGGGGYAYSGNGGNGGNALLSVGTNLTLTSNNETSDLYVSGGNGYEGGYYYSSYYGSGVNGNGGSATLLVGGSVSIDSSFADVSGGDADYYGYGLPSQTEGAGGNAYASMQNLSLTSTNYNANNIGTAASMYVTGGYGAADYKSALGGAGGSASLIAGSVSIDSSYAYVEGGNAAYDTSSYYGMGQLGQTEGAGGSALMSVQNLTMTSNDSASYGNSGDAYLSVAGGSGANDDNYANGGNGGNAILATTGAVSVDSAEVTMYGGEGGYAFYGANGGNGGNAMLSVGSNLTLTSTNDNSQLYVYGGEGGYGDEDGSVSGNGGAASLLVSGAVSIDSAEAKVYGGEGDEGYGFAGQTEGSGGNAYASMASLSLTSNEYDDGVGNGTQAYFAVEGGEGAYDYYEDYGPGGNAGNGGNGTLLISKGLSVDSAEVTVYGGGGGYAYSGNGGSGGNALLEVGTNLTLTSNNETGSLYVEGGYGYYGGYYSYYYHGFGVAGNGGSATLLVGGSVSIDSSSADVAGGEAYYYGYGVAGQTEGAGGNAYASMQNLNLTSTNYNANLIGNTASMYVTGGYGAADYKSALAGAGGSASLVAGSVSIDSSDAYVEGGNAGYDTSSSYYGMGQLGQTEGAGGSALMSVQNLTMTSNAYATYGNSGDSELYIKGGSGANDDNYATGGNGGNATLTANTVSMDGDSYLEIDGGNAGYNYDSYANGGNGGNAVLTANTVVLNHGSGINLYGGEGEYGSNYGNDGNALVNINSLNLVDSGSYLDVYGGDYSTGFGGAANVTIGTLNGAGSIYVESYDTNGNLSVSSGNFSGAISGDEVLEKTGTGTLTLTGANTYSGGTSVLSGTLAVGSAGALGTSDVAVEGGILATSGGPSTINVAGNYTQGGTGTLQLGLAGTAVGQYDTLSVSGAATLGGALELTSYNGFIPSAGQTFALVNSVGALSKEFGAVGDTFFQPLTVTYLANQVDVTTGTTTFAQLGSTSNDTSIGAALDALAKSGNGNPALSYALTSATNAQLQKLFNEISPSNLTPLYQMGFSLNNAQSSVVVQHLAGLWGGSGFGTGDYSWNNQGTLFAANIPASDEAAMANEAQPDRWGVFVNGVANFGSVTGTSNAPGYQYSLGGTTAGVDYRFSKDIVGGLLLGYSSSGTSESTGSVNQTGGQLGLYGGWKQDALHVEALAEGGINSYTTQRNTFGGSATGSTQGLQLSGQLGAGYDFKMDQMKWGPFVTAQYTNVSMDAFQESGSSAPLSYGAQSEDSLITDLGAQASKSWDMGGGFILTPQISAAWEHLYQGNLDSLSANFGTSTSGFSVNGPDMGTDGVAIGLGVNAQVAKGFNAYLQYQGVVAITNYDSQDFGAGLNIGF